MKTTAAKIRTALGLPDWTPRPEFDETDTRVSTWSVRELDAVFTRTGGTVTAHEIKEDGEEPFIRLTVIVDIPDAGPVEIFTDWDPANEIHGLQLSVIRALSTVPATA